MTDRRILAVLLGLSLIAAACTGGDGDTESSETGPEEQVTLEF
ncbi:MAG TPA: hypothetical protein VF028_13890 [Actinomycetota bacterium]|jgi:hypothetical protein|nr:hypothetical protein [Actinomycetota bacterium]